ncbi:hypothetical protein NT6N_20610 [Oceaniferula spumae]|uniref:Uncharacterized protein n=1 Tax=Oceaniferula spumae TaxID=2979115 RepID=A0AAT9FM77_9BACT
MDKMSGVADSRIDPKQLPIHTFIHSLNPVFVYEQLPHPQHL